MKKNFYHIETDPYKFAINNKIKSLRKKYIFLALFILFSLMTLFSAFCISFLSIMKLAKFWIFNPGNSNSNTEWQNKLIDNYVYITSTINAIVTLMGSIASFFAFKEGYYKYRIIYRKLDWEIIQYNEGLGNYFNKNEQEKKSILINKTSIILDVAKDFVKEVNNENI